MRKRWGIWVLFLLGFLCCCLPLLAHLYSQKEQEQVIATYQKTIQNKKLDVKELRKQAEHYNSILYQTNGATLSGEDALLLGDASYASLLDTTGTGVMGSMDIPKIGVELPIYHGTSEEVLSKGIGHLQGSSLPVGGESTHSILTGHRGLPQSKLLTRLDELEEGDYFFFHVLDETLAYQVTEIQVVKPEEVSVLKIQEGGVGKTTTTVNLGIGLAREGKKVLLIDADPQGSLTASLGYVEPDELGVTLATIMTKVINEDEISEEDGILHHQENVDLLPANIELSTLELTMGNVMSREMIMKEYIDTIRFRYDYILIDCLPSLGMMTINALVSSDSVLIPVQAAYLPVKGLQQLIKTISMVKKRLNRKLTIEGILLTMVDFRTNYAKDIAALVQKTYGSQIAIFKNVIPMSVKAAETSAEGISIYTHCPKGKVSMAYMNLTQEVMNDEK